MIRANLAFAHNDYLGLSNTGTELALISVWCYEGKEVIGNNFDLKCDSYRYLTVYLPR
jgi:hypothetical protein